MKSAAVAIIVGLLFGSAAIPLVAIDAATSLQGAPNKKSSDRYLGPIVDYDLDPQVAALSNPKERELREARGRRYIRRAPEPLAQLPSNWEGFATGSDWYVQVPALPVSQSDAVVVGEVTASQAHLSNDKTGVYSEFCIRIKEVLKNYVNSALHVGEVTVGEREGGVVRFLDGRLFQYSVYHQGMPRLGREYVFFLSRNKEGEDYSIVTAYEFRRGQVVPLDESSAFASLQGTDQQDFLLRVRDEIGRRPPPPKERKEER